jgi:hypothetical protein
MGGPQVAHEPIELHFHALYVAFDFADSTNESFALILCYLPVRTRGSLEAVELSVEVPKHFSQMAWIE